MFYLNKPLSPHLTIYKIQFSSLISILHRIASISLLILCIYFIIIYEFCLNLFYYDFLLLYKLKWNLINFFIIFLLFLSFFHFINGWKIILWNYNIFNQFKYLNWLNIFIVFFMCTVLLL